MSVPLFRCGDAARDRSDPLLGTAPQTLRWLLIEHPSPWKTNAVAGSDLLGPVRTALLQPPPLTRVLLIRRHGRLPHDSGHARHWAVADTGGQVRWGSWITGDDLTPAVDLLRSDEPISGAVDPLVLVCTHGVHDQCCALRGRPVAAALDRRFPEATWECTHLGGDRFAANLVVLPDGILYGNLDGLSAPQVVTDHLRGRVTAGRLRGSTAFPPVVQAAVGAIHDQLGPLPVDAVRLLRHDQLDPDHWRVTTAVAGGADMVAVIRTHRREPAALTCRAVRETSALGYTLESLTESLPDAPS